MMTQSLLCTGTWLLGFQWVGGGMASHLHTEGDRETNSKDCTRSVGGVRRSACGAGGSPRATRCLSLPEKCEQ
jgi:hypothetical protein